MKKIAFTILIFLMFVAIIIAIHYYHSPESTNKSSGSQFSNIANIFGNLSAGAKKIICKPITDSLSKEKDIMSGYLNNCNFNLDLISRENTNTMGYSSFRILYPGNYLISKNNKYRFTYEKDGSLTVRYYLNNITWKNKQKPPSGLPGTLVVQSDLNVVAYDSKRTPYWESATGGRDGFTYPGWGYNIVMENDGRLILYDLDDKIIKILTDT